MTNKGSTKRSFSPKGMIETQIIEREIQRGHSRYLARNLKQLAKITAARLTGFLETVLKRVRQREQTAR